MNVKLYCLLILFFMGGSAFAGAIIDSNSTSGRSAIQSSNVNYNDDLDNEILYKAINEVQNQIKQNPYDYSLNAVLIDLYLKTGQWEKAYEELSFLNNIKNQNKLDTSVVNNLETIQKRLKQTSKYDKNRSNILLNMAMISLITGDNTSVYKYLNAAARDIRNFTLFKNVLEKAADSSKNYENAVFICDAAIIQSPAKSDIRKLKAHYLVLLKKNDEAIEEYKSVIYINPKDNESKYELYKLLTEKNMPDKDLIKCFDKTGSNPESVYYDLGQILLENNDIYGAKKYTDILVKKYPENVNGYILMSEIYKKEGNLEEAYEALSKVRDKADSNESIAKYNVMLAKLSDEPLSEANSLMANGLYSQALEVLDSAGSQESLYVLLAKARANYFLSNKQAALEFLNRAMTFYPNNSDVYCAFGYIYLQEKDIESAQKYTDESLKINPNNRTARDLKDMVNKAEADKYVSRIVSSFESQNYTETMRLINEALSINPKDSILYYYKGLTYIAQNNYAASTAPFYKALELDKNTILPYFYLGIAFDNLSEPKNALMYYQKFVNLLPKEEYGESEKIDYAKVRIEKLKK
ncbi:MAG: hypothetical protein LUG16_07690 [Candidatus Gastranaerophilales bacterium]|nr:hypothetical protein [Candidatus Gastranaerophilales bacterium]